MDYLEIIGTQKHTTVNKIIGDKLLGFHREKLWYDGRSKTHYFSIIDDPIGESILSEWAIKSDVLGFDNLGHNLSENTICSTEFEEFLKYIDK